jgi:hypothetical protein
MQKKALVVFLVSVAINASSSNVHRLCSLKTQRKPLTAPMFTASVKMALDNSVGVLKSRVARRTALLSDRVEKKCAKK